MYLALISIAFLLFLALFFKFFVRVRFIPQDSDLFDIIEEFEEEERLIDTNPRDFLSHLTSNTSNTSMVRSRTRTKYSHNISITQDIYEELVAQSKKRKITVAEYLKEIIVLPEHKREKILTSKYRYRKNSPNRYYWINEAVKDKIIKPSELNDVPSKYKRMTYPQYIRKV
jgi:predicted CopG family antitoxin